MLERLWRKGNLPILLMEMKVGTVTILTEAEVTKAEVPILWLPDANSWLTGKVPDAGKDWGQKEKRASETETAGWHHWCNGHELGQKSGDGEGQGGLACYSPWGCKKLDTTGQLNNKSHCGEENEDFLKTKNITNIGLHNPTPGHTPRENHNSERYMHANVHWTIYNNQDMKATKARPSTEEWIKKMCVQFSVTSKGAWERIANALKGL